MLDDEARAEIFDQSRQRLFGIAYRMLGTRADAEDIVQEAYLRWHKTDAGEVETPEAWLVTITTRLSIDRLRRLQKERETYIGPWLPEPLSTEKIYAPAEEFEFASNLSLAFLALLEKLSPPERAAFLLREVFDVSYTEIARIVGKSEPACRQLISRARDRVRQDKPRFAANEVDKRRLIEKFAAAVSAHDEAALLALFAEDAVSVADSGGLVTAARKPIIGNRKIARLYYYVGLQAKKLSEKTAAVVEMRIAPINGELGLVTILSGQVYSATVFDIEGEQIRRLYQVMNPEKLNDFVWDKKIESK